MSVEKPYKRFILPNKLTVLLYPVESLLSAFSVLYVRVGTIYEKLGERGISHFTEHVAFQGTKDYSSRLKISQATQDMGASVNGWTDRFSTQYWARLPHTHIEKGVYLLSQLVFEPALNEGDILKEKSVVLSEYNDFWNNPEKKFGHEAWRKRFHQKEHPYSYIAFGIPEVIEKLDKKSILDWREQYYHPANMVLSIAGNLKGKKVEELVEKGFGKEKSGARAKEPKFSPNDYSGFRVYHQPEERLQIKFLITFPAFGWRQFPRRKRLEIILLNHIFGGSSASRLFQRLREKERYVYRAGSKINLHPWMGALQIWGSVPIKKLIPAVKAVREEIDKLHKEGANNQEVEQAKNFLAATRLLRFDNPASIARYFASQEFNGEEIWLPEKYIEEAEKVTTEHLNQLAKKIFDYSKTNICLLGKIPDQTLKEVEGVFKS